MAVALVALTGLAGFFRIFPVVLRERAVQIIGLDKIPVIATADEALVALVGLNYSHSRVSKWPVERCRDAIFCVSSLLMLLPLRRFVQPRSFNDETQNIASLRPHTNLRTALIHVWTWLANS